MPVQPGRTTQAWRRIRKLAYERDKAADAPCAICHQPIDYSLRPSSCGMAYEPDHIHDVRRHPELADCLDNTQAAHTSCNRSKKDKATVDPLGNQSRDWG